MLLLWLAHTNVLLCALMQTGFVHQNRLNRAWPVMDAGGSCSMPNASTMRFVTEFQVEKSVKHTHCRV